ncbi:TniQ family protein [Xanthomonas oryzae]|uniref:TniQ family protein n=1 Tax=Xanthomonas oryzae TaxID=347 RepID=UPI001033053F|nr:TniQ family protein [Xanthomonas oryzae]QBH00943.1 hypothetical protein EYC56_18750 [Xanthomonas oryzae]
MPRLYPLPLQGLGTEDVEALPSYLVRLAAAHGVSVHQLFAHLAPDASEDRVNAHRTLQATSLAALVRANATTDLLAQTLANIGVEKINALRSATFLPLREVLNRSMRGFSKELRWCPACLQEQMRSDTPVYFKLAWLLQDVKACRHHRMRLREVCRRCRKSLDGKSRWASLAKCCHCEAALFQMRRTDRIVLDPQATAPDLILLIADMAAAPSSVFPPHGVSSYLRKLLDLAVNTRHEIDLFRSLPYEECLRYASDNEPITLGTARRLAYYLEVPIFNLLLGGEGANRSFGFAFKRPLPVWLARPHRSRSPHRDRLQSQLSEWLEKPPLPLARIAKRMGISTGALRYQCPDQVAMIASRWKQKAKEDRESKMKAAKLTIWTEIAHWDCRHKTPMSRKALMRVVREKSSLPKHILRRAIVELYPSESSEIQATS